MADKRQLAAAASRAVTILLHPLLMPVYCALLTLFGPTPYGGLPHDINVRVLRAVGIFACANPLMVIGAFILMGKVSELEMPSRAERVWPLMASGLAIGLSLLALNVHNTPRPLLGMILGESLALFLAGLCSLRWKVSLHTIGSGALLAYVSVAGMAYHLDFAPWAAAAFVCAGLTAWARHHAKAHTWRQLLGGYALGLAVMGATMNMVMSRPVL